MKTIKVSEATGIQLDWLVAKCEGHDVVILTVEEQRARWFKYVHPKDRGEEEKEYDAYLELVAAVKICVSGDEGYKRAPSHKEALMLYSEGPPKFQYSTSWAQGGPIIERMYAQGLQLKLNAFLVDEGTKLVTSLPTPNRFSFGPTPLIAAMRCYVFSEMGEEVDIPRELV